MQKAFLFLAFSLALTSSTNAFAASPFPAYVGKYEKVSGETILDGKCPATFEYAVDEKGDLNATSEEKEFNQMYSYLIQHMNQKAYDCVNKGNPLINQCYRDSGNTSSLVSKYIHKNTLFLFETEQSRTSTTRKKNQLTVSYKAKDKASEACVYKRI
ncbi:MAG: hypothetical protein AB7P04_06885 [Bacteriovoracia bacterium]